MAKKNPSSAPSYRSSLFPCGVVPAWRRSLTRRMAVFSSIRRYPPTFFSTPGSMPVGLRVAARVPPLVLAAWSQPYGVCCLWRSVAPYFRRLFRSKINTPPTFFHMDDSLHRAPITLWSFFSRRESLRSLIMLS
jgi:hypothetical protein